MESKYFSSHVFEIKLYHNKDVADLYYELLNIILLICYNSDYYCFCDKYQGDIKRAIIWEGTSVRFVILRYILVMTSGILKNI